MPNHRCRALPFAAMLVALTACSTQPKIDPADLPPEAKVDDGIDYYSASLEGDEILEGEERQWTTDEDGNRVYLVNRAPRDVGAGYYVGDIRYVYVNRDPNTGRGTGYANAPILVSRGGAPLQSPTFRGSRNNTYYQTRRGRVVYLPGNQTPPASNTPQTSSSSGQSGSAPSVSPRPSRPTTVAPRPSPRPAPTRSQPTRRASPVDTVRRPDQ